jgi:hypothetical protein
MSNIVQKDELQRAKVALVINVMTTLVTFITLLNMVNTGVTWRIVCVALGFICFFCLTVFVSLRFVKLQKTYRQAV